jgi:hypothetical protein
MAAPAWVPLPQNMPLQTHPQNSSGQPRAPCTPTSTQLSPLHYEFPHRAEGASGLHLDIPHSPRPSLTPSGHQGLSWIWGLETDTTDRSCPGGPHIPRENIRSTQTTHVCQLSAFWESFPQRCGFHWLLERIRYNWLSEGPGLAGRSLAEPQSRGTWGSGQVPCESDLNSPTTAHLSHSSTWK